MSLLFRVEQGTLRGPEGVLLEGADISLTEGRVTALLGPVGTGKSTLLRALAGRPFAPGWEREGRWHFRDGALGPPPADGDDRLWIAQQRRRTSDPCALWDVLEASAQSIWLLDEPVTDSWETATDRLKALLRRRASGGAIVVTHHLGLARAIADDVCLLCAGRVAYCGEAATFFERPPTELVRRFLTQGNCWPPAPAPALPSHFHWLLPDALAGMGCPGLLDPVDDDLGALAAAGITLVVSLTKEPFPVAKLREFGLDGRHLPVPDMGVPATAAVARLCRSIERVLSEGGRVAVHCRAGLGRTGTLLASYLVWTGSEPDDAITAVRALRRGMIQNAAQESFVRRFGASL
jgi:atypical dual specificity phosphatase